MAYFKAQYQHPPGGTYENMQSEVLTAVKMSMFILWVVILCGLVGRSP
jgi:hypothetical protein